jgi:SAM-dependent methyltransferase
MILKWLQFLESVGNIPISDEDEYVRAMFMGAKEKTFFLKMIQPDVIVDFGCADGQVLGLIEQMKPNVKLIGYDLSQEMLNKAKSIVSDKVTLTTDWSLVTQELKKYKNPTLLLSSVIHEVYSYGNTKVVKDFWNKQVFGGNFKFIAIRDMIPPISMERVEKSHYIEDIMKVKDNFEKEYIDSFEQRWGPMENNYRTFIHFLLKYKYTKNWERENNENYVPISLETLHKKIPSNYSIKFEKSYLLDWLRDKVKEDFDVILDHPTHIQMLIQNNNFKNESKDKLFQLYR